MPCKSDSLGLVVLSLTACAILMAMFHPARAATDSDAPALYPEVETFVRARVAEFDQIPLERRAVLGNLGSYVRAQLDSSGRCQLIFICTHNSRRSHMGQVWCAIAAAFYERPGVVAYSGGTESTAFNPRAVDALRRAGLRIEQTTQADNPIYHVRFSDAVPAITCFSKVFDQAPNPKQGFAAVMTCAQADAACPSVPGADARFAIPYEDPKAFDGDKLESIMYDERCAQIAREMLYLFSQVREIGSR